MKLWDSHMHTPLCKHAAGEPNEYAEEAVRKGLGGIIFTCHSPMPDGFWPSVRMSSREFERYVSLIERTASDFSGRLEVRLGLESDFFPGTEDFIAELHRSAPLQYVLGSVHWQGPEYRDKFGSTSFETEVATYFDLVAASAESGLFDALAHADLVKNLSPGEWHPEKFSAIIESALDRVAATGVAMEINTSGRHKRFSEFNPGSFLLRRMKERNIPVVLGSDSHVPDRVGEGFGPALRALKDAGYEEVAVFEEREAVLKSLPKECGGFRV